MAQSIAEIKQRYPLPVYNYRVSVIRGGLGSTAIGIQLAETIDSATDLGGVFSLLSCSEISGLKMEIDTTVYQHGLSFLTGMHIIPGRPKPVNLSIKKGVTAKGQYFSDWMQISYPYIRPLPFRLLRKRDLLIDLCDENGLPIVRWVVLKAMPTSLQAPSFSADTQEVAFEQLDLIAHELMVDYNPNDLR